MKWNINIVYKIAIMALIGTASSILSSSILFSNYVSAYSASITTSNSISLDVSPAGDGTAIHSESINVVSDCRNGYNLSISTPNGSDLYKYTNGVADSTASFTAVDGTSALSSSNNTNKWGFVLSSNPTSSTVFSPLSTTPSILKTSTETASSGSDINDTFSIHYGIKVDGTIEPGTYQMADNGSNTPGSIVYQLTMEPTCLYTVQYQDNGADNPNGMGTTDSTTGDKSVKQINIDEDTTITLLAPNFKKAGYAFLGWSTDQNAYAHFTDNDNTNDPIIYGPMEDVVIDSTMIAASNNRNQINMYAVWIPALKDGNDDPVYMQEWDNPNTNLPHDGCSTLTATIFDDTVTDEKGKIQVTKGSVVALTDKRDNEVYTIARLADGNCWMTENLRLEAAGTVGQNINDPNVTNQYLSQGYGGTTGRYGNFIGLANPESANFSSDESIPNSMYKSSANPPVDTYNPITGTLEDVSTTQWGSYRIPRYNNVNNSEALVNPTYTEDYLNPSNPSTSGVYKVSRLSSYGNYYNWAAAIANTNFYASSSDSEVTGTSICPSAWHLPSSGSTNKEFGVLTKSYGGTGGAQYGIDGGIISNRFRAFPNNYLISGSFSGSLLYSLSGQYWSRSQREGYGFYAYNLDIRPTSIVPSSIGLNTYTGSSARCLIGPSGIEVLLDSNNGTGTVSRVYGAAGNSVSLPIANSARETQPSINQLDYTFKNWNTSPDGSGTSYTSSYSIPAGSTGITLYAQWTPQYTITYVNNCYTYASTNTSCTQEVSNRTGTQKIGLDNNGNGSGTLGAYNYNSWTLTGWKIKGWSTVADNSAGSNPEYLANNTYSVTGQNAGDGITLYAHWVPIYTVQYDGNGSDNDSTGMGSTNATTGIKAVAHTNVAEGDTFDLFASNFKRAGYGFVGWSTDSDAWNKLTDNDATNDAKIWGPNEIITAPAYNGTPITTLYAIWAPAEKTDPGDPTSTPVYLQNWTGCSAMTATTYDATTGKLTVSKNSITALTDQRDGNVYTIAKLADENCWMVENLRLDNTPELSTTNTNINSTNSTLPITNVYNVDSSLATKSNYLSATSSSWCTTNSAACYDQSLLNTTNITETATPSKTQSITSANAHSDFYTAFSYGNNYNWYSATAGYGTYSRSTSEPTAGDLCPAGWKLPYGNTGTSGTVNIGGTKGGFSYLDTQMGGTGGRTTYQDKSIASNKWRMFPNNFIYSGYWSGSSRRDRGNKGYYWSASASSNASAYGMFLGSTDIAPGNNQANKYFGRSVRCVAGS